VDLPRFFREFLGWEAGDLAGGPGGPPLPSALEVVLSEYGERLVPTYAVPDPAGEGYVLLIQCIAVGQDLDEARRQIHGRPVARERPRPRVDLERTEADHQRILRETTKITNSWSSWSL